MNTEQITILLDLFFLISRIAMLLFIFFIIRGIWRAFKRFLFELIDHIKGTPGNSSGQSYRDEARKACDRTAPKKNKYATPPWEE